MNIGKNLKEIRSIVGLTQKEFGSLVGYSQQQIAQYESGYRTPGEKTLDLLCNKLFENPTSDMLYHQFNADDPFTEVFSSPEAIKHYILTHDEDLSAIAEPFFRLNERGQAKVISYAYDLADDEKYKK